MENKIEETIEKPYTLRKLKNGDLWTVVKILGKVLPDDLKNAFVQVAAKEKTINELGYMVMADLGVMIVKNTYKAQDDVDAFCADLAGITTDELNDMEFGTSAMIIMDIIGDAKNASFFKVLSKFIS